MELQQPFVCNNAKDNYLHDQHQREECFKVPVPCLMTKYIHRYYTAKGAKASGGKEQHPLRNPAFSLPGTMLIIPHQEEAEQIRYQNNTNYNNQLHI